MGKFKRAVITVFVCLMLILNCAAQTEPASRPSPPTEEQLNVYRSWFDTIGVQLHVKNLADVTVPFDFKGFPAGRPCLQGITLESPPEYFRATHVFGPGIAKRRGLRLVDRHKQLNLFRKIDRISGNEANHAEHDGNATKNDLDFVIFSEIAFDKGHQIALLKYILVCGEHCDSGATLVLEKVDGHWAAKPRLICAGFVNNSFSEMPD